MSSPGPMENASHRRSRTSTFAAVLWPGHSMISSKSSGTCPLEYDASRTPWLTEIGDPCECAPSSRSLKAMHLRLARPA